MWDPINGGERQGKGNTRDISVSGAYILSDCRPPLGSAVQMAVTLPALSGSKRAAQLFIDAETMRVDASGFAVTGKTGFQLDYRVGEPDELLPEVRKDTPQEEALVFFSGLVTRA